MFAGRVEAKLVVPSPGASVSVTVANGGAAATATLPAASYYATQAGGVSSWITALQTALNNASQGYPQTAAAMAAAVGYGTWSAAWLMNEPSGNAIAAFGGVNLTASGVTYLNTGPRSGIDYAIGFDTGTDTLNAGDNFDPLANDQAIAIIAKFGATGDFDIVGKGYPAGGSLMVIESGSGGLARFIVNDGVNSASAQAGTAIPTGVWLALIGVLDRSTNKLRFGWRRLDGVSSSVSTEASTTSVGSLNNGSGFIFGNNFYGAHTSMQIAFAAVAAGSGAATGLSANLSTALTNFANAINAAWTLSMSTTDGRLSIGWTGYATPTWSWSWTSTALRDVAGFTADITNVTTTQTGTQQVEGVWFPDCPLNIEGDPYQAPRVSDLRTSQSPTGVVLGLTGNSFYRHRGVVWSHVPKDRTWESAVTYANASFQHWFDETQLGLGSSFFSPSSPIQIYGLDGTLVGGAYSSGTGVSGWTITGLSSCEPKPAVAQWTGLFRIEFPELISSG